MLDMKRVFYRQIGLSDAVFKSQPDTLFQTVMQERSVEAAEDNEILLYGDIVSDMAREEASLFGVTEGLVSPKEFKVQLKQVVTRTDKDIKMRINSRGGEIFAAGVIYQALNEVMKTGRRIEASVDGLAASAASFVMLASNARYVHSLSSVMIHRGHGFAMGNAEDFRHGADILEAQDMKVVPIYARHMNMDEEQVLSLMSSETWYHGKGIVDAGLADYILADGSKTIQQRMETRQEEMNMSMARSVWKY